MVAKCIGCGHCCKLARCYASVQIYGFGLNICPALEERSNGTYRCRLISIRGGIGEFFKEWLCVGYGCTHHKNEDRLKILYKYDEDN
jgi:hypothetical protein